MRTPSPLPPKSAACLARDGVTFATYRCVRCGAHGSVRSDTAVDVSPEEQKRLDGLRRDRERREEAERQQSVAYARFLWSQRRPIEHSPAETYLRQARGYRGRMPSTLASLPPLDRKTFPAVMGVLAPVVEVQPGLIVPTLDVRGVHVISIRDDGMGKAPIPAPKKTYGKGAAGVVPLTLSAMNDLLGLVIVEGIENGLSVFEATGCGVWVSCGHVFMPKLAKAVPEWVDTVVVIADPDEGFASAETLVSLLKRRVLDDGAAFTVELRTLGEAL